MTTPEVIAKTADGGKVIGGILLLSKNISERFYWKSSFVLATDVIF